MKLQIANVTHHSSGSGREKKTKPQIPIVTNHSSTPSHYSKIILEMPWLEYQTLREGILRLVRGTSTRYGFKGLEWFLALERLIVLDPLQSQVQTRVRWR